MVVIYVTLSPPADKKPSLLTNTPSVHHISHRRILGAESSSRVDFQGGVFFPDVNHEMGGWGVHPPGTAGSLYQGTLFIARGLCIFKSPFHRVEIHEITNFGWFLKKVTNLESSSLFVLRNNCIRLSL